MKILTTALGEDENILWYFVVSWMWMKCGIFTLIQNFHYKIQGATVNKDDVLFEGFDHVNENSDYST